MTDDLSFLQQTELLDHVSEETLRLFHGASRSRHLRAGATLFEQGEPGVFLFVLVEGALDALTTNSHGQSLLLRTLGPGDVGGLTSLTLDQPRSATLRARRDCRLLVVDKPRFIELLEQRSDLARSLIATLSRKVRGKTRQLASLMDPSAGDRFRVAFFDTKPYDRDSFSRIVGDEIHFTWFSPRLDAHTAELAQGHQAVCAFVNDDLSRPTLESLARLGVQLVALRCAGFNNVDLQAARDLGLAVVRVPAYSPHAVAEHALALLLTLNRKTHRAFNRVHEGNFALSGLVGFDLFGKTAGVVGTGQIGRCMARILLGLSMDVLAFDVAPDQDFAAEHGIRYVALDELLERSDVITLHAPLVPATRHLLNTDRLARTKRGVFIINTSRGGLIDSKALIEALKSGHIGAAGLDVYEEESEYFFEDHSDMIISDDLLARLMTFNNVLITSHQAFLTREALSSIARVTRDNILAFARGEEPVPNLVSDG